jgi:hypothetical protein
VECGKKFGSHLIAVHNDPLHSEHPGLLLVAGHDGRQSDGQMGIPPMSHSQQWVTVLVVQQDQCSTSQHDTQAPHQSSRDQCIGVHRLAMPIDVEGGGRTKVFLC